MTAQIFDIYSLTPDETASIAQALCQGAVAVFPTDTVYGIGTGVFCENAIKRIYQIKQRPANQPLQILTASVEQAQQIAYFSQQAQQLARAFWPGPLTLIVPPAPSAKALTRGFAGLGIRVPAMPLLTKILSSATMPLASTSANLHGSPVLTDENEVLTAFISKVDIIIKGGTLSPVASSVADVTADIPVLLREGKLSKTDLEGVLKRPFSMRG